MGSINQPPSTANENTLHFAVILVVRKLIDSLMDWCVHHFSPSVKTYPCHDPRPVPLPHVVVLRKAPCVQARFCELEGVLFALFFVCGSCWCLVGGGGGTGWGGGAYWGVCRYGLSYVLLTGRDRYSRQRSRQGRGRARMSKSGGWFDEGAWYRRGAVVVVVADVGDWLLGLLCGLWLWWWVWWVGG